MNPYRVSTFGRTIFAAILLLILTLVAGAAPLDDLLTKFPGQNGQDTGAACAALLSLDAAALAALCDRLQPDITGGADLAVRYAVSGLTKHVMAPDRAAERARLEQVYLAGLQRATDLSIKAFLVVQLQWIASDASVPAMTALLADKEMVNPAAITLENVKTEAAGAALLSSFSAAPEDCQTRIVKALGELGYAPAKDALLAAAQGGNTALAAEARSALGGLGAPEAEDMLFADFAQAADAGQRAPVVAGLDRLLQRTIARNDLPMADQLCRRLLATNDITARIAGLEGLVTIKGDQAQADLAESMKDANPVFRGAALRLAARIRGAEASEYWADAAEKAATDAHVQIIAMLALRKDETARKAVAKAVKDKDPAVRMAALQTMDGKSALLAIKPLMALVEDTGDAKERTAAEQAALRAPGDEVIERAAKALPKANPDAQRALMDILAARKASEQMDVVADLLKENDESVRVKALSTLAIAGTAAQLMPAHAALLDAANESEEKAAVDALAAMKSNATDAGAFLARVNDDFGKTDDAQKFRLVRLIARLNDPALAQRALTEVIENGVCTEALRVEAAAQIADNAPATYPECCRIAAALPAGAVRDAVLAGMNRVIVKTADEAAVPALIKTALDQQSLKSAAETEALLDALSRHRSLQALSTAAGFLDNPETVAAATKAMAAIGCKKGDREKGLTDAESLALLEKARDLAPDQGVKDQIQEHLTAARQPATP